MKPNIVFINTDQQRWDTLGCYGSAIAQTPNIDALAEAGVRFDRCYTTNPVCMPARASWWTGQYPSHHGVWMNGVPLNTETDTLPAAMSRAGYHTALIGKIHLDNVWDRKAKTHPTYGFDLLLECEGDPYCYDDYFEYLRELNLFDDYMAQFMEGGHSKGYVRRIAEPMHMNNWVTDHIEKYLVDRAGDRQPFFLSAAYFDPHHPFDPCEPYASRFKAQDMPMPVYEPGEEEGMAPPVRQRFETCKNDCLNANNIRGIIAAYHATVAHVDAMVGRIVTRLETLGLAKNTIIIFSSDHGEMLGDHGILHKGPMFYEGAIRVPLIYRFPDPWQRPSAVCDRFVSHVDLTATVAALTKTTPPAGCQGRSLFNAEGELLSEAGRDHAITEWRDRPPGETDKPYQAARCLTTDRWKFVHYHHEDFGELYDRLSDPHEHRNLFEHPDHAAVKSELKAQLLDAVIESDCLPTRTDIF